MAGSSYGNIFRITTWGESHGAGVGVVVDGCPAGLKLCEEDIQKVLDRRKPGQSKYATPRNEADKAIIMSGVFEGLTTGTPISILVENADQHSKDYSNIANSYRPGHADLTFDEKYGIRDYRGGGRSSGRETIGRAAAGAVALKVLNELGIYFITYARSIGPVTINEDNFDAGEITNNPFCMPDAEAAKKAGEFLDKCIEDKDSSGGIIECVITGMPAGIGDTVFDKLDACLAKAVFSIGAVKGFEIGSGFNAAKMKGSENNDPFYITADGKISKVTNNAGGILGGMSDASPIVFRAAVKPTPSIARPQQTVTKDKTRTEIIIHGRHDPVIVPRAVVVVECMAAIAITDLLLSNMGAKMSSLRDFYL